MTVNTVSEYMEEVLQILESFDYPTLVIDYEVKDVSFTIANTIINQYLMGTSAMMCAIIIWSLTLNLHVIPDTRDMVKH